MCCGFVQDSIRIILKGDKAPKTPRCSTKGQRGGEQECTLIEPEHRLRFDQGASSVSTCVQQKKEAHSRIGVSRGDKTTRIHAVVNGLGNPVYLQLSVGNEADCAVAVDVLSHVPLAGRMVLADSGYDSDEILVYIEDRDARQDHPVQSQSQ